MLNASKYQENKQTSLEKPQISIETLNKMYNEGKKIFHLITQNHFTELNLQLTAEIIELARQERISQLTGSNQNSVLLLLKAYLEFNPGDKLILEDNSHLLEIASRIAVILHFNANSN